MTIIRCLTIYWETPNQRFCRCQFHLGEIYDNVRSASLKTISQFKFNVKRGLIMVDILKNFEVPYITGSG